MKRCQDLQIQIHGIQDAVAHESFRGGAQVGAVERHDLRNFGPALLITETCFNAVGAPVNFARDYHRGSHFTFSFTRK